MKRKVKLVLYGLSLFSLLLVLGGIWVGLITKGATLPEWVGNVVAAFTGGVLGLLGNLVVIWTQQIAQRIQQERNITFQSRASESKAILEFFGQLRRLFLRLKIYQYMRSNAPSADSLVPRVDEVSQVLKQVPTLPSWLYEYDDLWQKVDILIAQGLDLLLMEIDDISINRIEQWENESRTVIKKIIQAMRDF